MDTCVTNPVGFKTYLVNDFLNSHKIGVQYSEGSMNPKCTAKQFVREGYPKDNAKIKVFNEDGKPLQVGYMMGNNPQEAYSMLLEKFPTKGYMEIEVKEKVPFDFTV